MWEETENKLEYYSIQNEWKSNTPLCFSTFSKEQAKITKPSSWLEDIMKKELNRCKIHPLIYMMGFTDSSSFASMNFPVLFSADNPEHITFLGTCFAYYAILTADSQDTDTEKIPFHVNPPKDWVLDQPLNETYIKLIHRIKNKFIKPLLARIDAPTLICAFREFLPLTYYFYVGARRDNFDVSSYFHPEHFFNLLFHHSLFQGSFNVYLKQFVDLVLSPNWKTSSTGNQLYCFASISVWLREFLFNKSLPQGNKAYRKHIRNYLNKSNYPYPEFMFTFHDPENMNLFLAFKQTIPHPTASPNEPVSSFPWKTVFPKPQVGPFNESEFYESKRPLEVFIRNTCKAKNWSRNAWLYDEYLQWTKKNLSEEEWRLSSSTTLWQCVKRLYIELKDASISFMSPLVFVEYVKMRIQLLAQLLSDALKEKMGSGVTLHKSLDIWEETVSNNILWKYFPGLVVSIFRNYKTFSSLASLSLVKPTDMTSLSRLYLSSSSNEVYWTEPMMTSLFILTVEESEQKMQTVSLILKHIHDGTLVLGSELSKAEILRVQHESRCLLGSSVSFRDAAFALLEYWASRDLVLQHVHLDNIESYTTDTLLSSVEKDPLFLLKDRTYLFYFLWMCCKYCARASFASDPSENNVPFKKAVFWLIIQLYRQNKHTFDAKKEKTFAKKVANDSMFKLLYTHFSMFPTPYTTI